jgi:hypothetical protein
VLNLLGYKPFVYEFNLWAFDAFNNDSGSFLHNFIIDSLNYLNEQVKEVEIKEVEIKEAEIKVVEIKEAEVKENKDEEVVISKYNKTIKILVNIFLFVHFVDFII